MVGYHPHLPTRPLNEAAKDFQKHSEVRELVPDTDPSWNGDALSSYSAPDSTR